MRALRAAFYHPERAVDYLLNGIPADLEQEQPQPRQPATSSSAAHGHSEGGASAAAGDNPLAFLQSNPMFATLRQRLLNEPQFFQTFMNQLSQTQPQLYQAISANPQAFLQLLLGGEGGDADQERDPPGTIRVTQEEKDAIDRLASLGFPKHRAIEAYLACDKNEEWAANYLFENAQGDDNYDEQVVQEESRADVEGDAAAAMDQDDDLYEGYVDDPQPPAGQPPSDNMQVDPPAPSSDADADADKPKPDENNDDKKDGDDEEGSSL